MLAGAETVAQTASFTSITSSQGRSAGLEPQITSSFFALNAI
jgi:hypothetical protein